MGKMNCWEVKKCGREKGGMRTSEFGVCPASELGKVHGTNGGTNGGRACWVVSGTLCGGEVQGSFAMKHHNCTKCNFYSQVKGEEGNGWKSSNDVLKILQT